LFGYTGGASIALAQAGASVTHVDASESAVKWAKINRDASGLAEDSIRFLVDDARKFVEREIRRGSAYDIIILDPPAYGRGAKNELWKIEDDLVLLIVKLQKIISKDPVAFLINGYASGYSHIAYKQIIESIMPPSGNLVSGELAIAESHTDRLLPCGIFARWEK
jgi:23S rRNA (cytosine1962-C5)-methyltransferase